MARVQLTENPQKCTKGDDTDLGSHRVVIEESQVPSQFERSPDRRSFPGVMKEEVPPVSCRCELIASHLFDLDSSREPKKSLSVELPLYQMEQS